MNERIKKIILQKLAGLFLLAGSAWMMYSASGAVIPEDKDCTAIIFMIPIGLFLLFYNKSLEDIR